MEKEFLKDLDKLNEDLEGSFSVPCTMHIESTTFTGVTTEKCLTLTIPEGVTRIDTSMGSFEWGLYSVAPGCGGHMFTKIDKVIIPSTVKQIIQLFPIQPQYDVTIEFNCDVMDIIGGDRDDSLIQKIFSAKNEEAKKERIERVLCNKLNMAWSRTEFVFNVPIDISKLADVDLEL